MDITLSIETQKMLEARLKSGKFRSVDDVVHAGLEALDELEAAGLDEQTLNAIDLAEDEIDRGEVYDWKDVREQVRDKFLGK